MRNVLTSLALVVAVAGIAGAAGPDPQTDEQKTLYALGIAMSQNLSAFNLTEGELAFVQAGLSDSVLHKPAKVELQQWGPKVQQLYTARVAATVASEKKLGQAFLDKAAAEKGATKTTSGLIITTLKPGTGAAPKSTDTVKVHYH